MGHYDELLERDEERRKQRKERVLDCIESLMKEEGVTIKRDIHGNLREQYQDLFDIIDKLKEVYPDKFSREPQHGYWNELKILSQFESDKGFKFHLSEKVVTLTDGRRFVIPSPVKHENIHAKDGERHFFCVNQYSVNNPVLVIPDNVHESILKILCDCGLVFNTRSEAIQVGSYIVVDGEIKLPMATI